MPRLFGTDGIRGVFGDDLTCNLAKMVGFALTKFIENNGQKRILIGSDTRESSVALVSSMADGICRGGGDVYIIGVCPTPAIAYIVKKHSFDAGVMISASHNPYQFNGIKIFGADGYKLSDEIEDKIEASICEINDDQEGSVKNYFYAINEYIEYLKSCFGISLSGLKIGIDSANGSASITAEKIFSSLGAKCKIIGNRPNGRNINEKCGSTDLEKLKKLVRENRLDVGLAFDGDADRCIAIDESGQEIDGDFILAILSLWLKEEDRLKNNTLVGTVMSNLGLRKFCKIYEIDFLSTAVGDRYVLEAMLKGDYSLGGEQSGHLILGDYLTTGDGQLTALALLSRMKKSGKTLSELAAVMRKYPQYMINISANSEEKTAFINDKIISEMIRNTEKFLGENARLVIRPSGTEPKIRIMAEGENFDEIKSACDLLSEKVIKRLHELKSSVRK